MAITYDVTTGLRALDGSNLISDIDTGLLSMAQDIANQRHDIQAGVIDSGSFMVTQKGAGANMSVDVASNSGRGAYVADSSSRLVFAAPTGSATNLAIGANSSGNPRIDIMLLSSAGVLSVSAGTPTAGATLDNHNGAAGTPATSLLLAEILVANGAASITNTVIRDRRRWARGAYCRIVRNANAGGTNDYSLASASNIALLDSVNVAPRIECSGVPVKVTLLAETDSTNTTAQYFFSPQVDSAGVDGMASVGASGVAASLAVPVTAGGAGYFSAMWEFVPAAGSHIIAPGLGTLSGTNVIRARAAVPLIWRVEELVRQNTANNTTTSG